MIRVQVRPNETLEAALRRFKRQCNYAGVFRLAKKYSYHEKRSDKRRREERERIRNIQRALRKATQKTRLRTMKRGKLKGRGASERDSGVDLPQTAVSMPLDASVGETRSAPAVLSGAAPARAAAQTQRQPEMRARTLVAEAEGPGAAGEA